MFFQPSHVPQLHRSILRTTEQRISVAPVQRNSHHWLFVCLKTLNYLFVVENPYVTVFISPNDTSWVGNQPESKANKLLIRRKISLNFVAELVDNLLSLDVIMHQRVAVEITHNQIRVEQAHCCWNELFCLIMIAALWLVQKLTKRFQLQV